MYFYCLRFDVLTVRIAQSFRPRKILHSSVKNAFGSTINQCGLQILQVLITDLNPDQRDKNVMNEIS